MKTVIKDGQKFIISDALYEASKTVNPTTANGTNLGNTPVFNNSNEYAELDYQTNNSEWLDYILGKKKDGSIDIQNTPMMSKISKDWQIIYNIPKFTEKIKKIINNTRLPVIKSMNEMTKSVNNLIKRQYKDVNISFIDLKSGLEEFYSNEENVNNLIMNVRNDIYKEQGVPLGENNTPTKVVELKHKGYSVDNFIKIAISHYIKQVVNKIFDDGYNNSPLKKVDAERIKTFIDGYIENTIQGLPGSVSQAVNVSSLKNTSSVATQKSKWSELQRYLQSIENNSNSKLNNAIVGLFKKAIKIHDTIIKKEIEENDKRTSGKKTESEIYNNTLISDAERYVQLDIKQPRSNINPENITARQVRIKTFELYNLYMNHLSAVTQYVGTALTSNDNETIIKNLISSPKIIKQYLENASSIKNDEIKLLRYTYRFLREYYGVEKLHSQSIFNNIDYKGEKNEVKNIDVDKFIGLICYCVNKFDKKIEQNIIELLKNIENGDTLNKLSPEFQMVFNNQNQMLLTVSFMLNIVKIDFANYMHLAQLHEEKQKYEEKQKGLTFNQHLNNFHVYMGRDVNESDIGELKLFRYKLEQRKADMKMLLDEILTLIDESYFLKSSVLCNLPGSVDPSEIKELKDVSIKNFDNTEFLRKMFAYIELSKAWEKIKPTLEKDNPSEKDKIDIGNNATIKILKTMFEGSSYITEDDLKNIKISAYINPIFNMSKSQFMTFVVTATNKNQNFGYSQYTIPQLYMDMSGIIFSYKNHSPEDIAGFMTVIDFRKTINKLNNIKFRITPRKGIR